MVRFPPSLLALAPAFAAMPASAQDRLSTMLDWFDIWPRFALRPGALDLGRYARFATFLLEQGAIDETVDPATLAVDVTALEAGQ